VAAGVVGFTFLAPTFGGVVFGVSVIPLRCALLPPCCSWSFARRFLLRAKLSASILHLCFARSDQRLARDFASAFTARVTAVRTEGQPRVIPEALFPIIGVYLRFKGWPRAD
jgi:hypothetical protein